MFRARARMTALLVAALCCLAIGSARAVELVFAAPRAAEGAEAVSSLRQAAVTNVRGGRAFLFDEVAAGADERVELVRRTVTDSRAVADVLGLWERARGVAPTAVQRWLDADGPVVVWVQPAGGAGSGPALTAQVPVRVVLSDGSTADSAHLLMVADLRMPGGRTAGVADLAAAGLLVPMLCHECFHGLMADLYRERYLLFGLLGAPKGAHDSPDETCPLAACKEGFAEAGELVLAGRHPDELYAEPAAGTVDEAVAAFARVVRQRRVELAGRNRYVFAEDGRIRDGRLDRGGRDVATEGVVASLLATVVERANLDDPWGALFQAMAAARPLTFFELVEALTAARPASAATLQRIVVEYTYDTVRSNEALERYQQYYLAKKAFVQGRLDRAAWTRARRMWQRWKDEQFEAVRSGAPLGAAVPQPLLVENAKGLGVDLNDGDVDSLAWCLEAFMPSGGGAGDAATAGDAGGAGGGASAADGGASAADGGASAADGGASAADGGVHDAARLATVYAGRIAERRATLGYFRSIDDVADAVPGWLFERFQAGRGRVERTIERRLAEAVTKRRTLAGY